MTKSNASNVEIVLLKQLASCLAMPMLVIGPDGELLYFNESAEPILARRFDETGRMSADEWMELIPTADADGVPLKIEERPMIAALNRRVPVNARFYLQGSDGRHRFVAGTAIPLEDLRGRLVGALGCFWELAPDAIPVPDAGAAAATPGQHPVETILMRRLAAKLAMPIFIVDVDGRLLYYNAAAESILGRRFDDLRDASREELYATFRPRDADGAPLRPEEHPLWEAQATREPVHRPIRIRGLDGIERLLEVTAIPLVGQSDRMLGAVGLFWEGVSA